MTALTVWIDARCGVAGDMLLGSLLDAGADLEVVRRDVEAVLPETVRLTVEPVTRGVMRASKLHVEPIRDDHHHRSWRTIRRMIKEAELPQRVRRDALAAFGALAEAEGHVHGTDPEDVHFHEVGAWDSIADVVGVCSALDDLGVERVLTSTVGVGDGFVRGAHGVVPVPVPAVLRLLERSNLDAHGTPHQADAPVGELATPTGVALLVALATPAPAMPAGTLRATGIGAGTKDGLPWANAVRAVLLEDSPAAALEPEDERRDLVVLDANVDDLDPRAWPGVLTDLLSAGALDAWLTPIVMKKGRPAHTLSALVEPGKAGAIREVFFTATTTLGVRETAVTRVALGRTWHPVPVELAGTTRDVRIKVARRGERILTATPEFEDCAELAAVAGGPVTAALDAAAAAARSAGLTPGQAG